MTFSQSLAFPLPVLLRPYRLAIVEQKPAENQSKKNPPVLGGVYEGIRKPENQKLATEFTARCRPVTAHRPPSQRIHDL
jgi:hypothetical protein